jgi:hypothetical protein
MTSTGVFTTITDASVGGNLTVIGDLTVSGTTTTINTATLSVEDPLIFLGNGNDTTDTVDLGVYGLYDTSGSLDLYGGMFRDATDNKFKFFVDSQVAPTATVNTAGTGYTNATVLVGELEVSSDTNTASIISAALAADRTYTIPDAGANVEFVMQGSTLSTVQLESEEMSASALLSASSKPVIYVTATGAAVTVTLPESSTALDGIRYTIVARDTTNDITITGDGAETIDGQASLILNVDDQRVTVMLDHGPAGAETRWLIV